VPLPPLPGHRCGSVGDRAPGGALGAFQGMAGVRDLQ
jgi:hypothetical protein